MRVAWLRRPLPVATSAVVPRGARGPYRCDSSGSAVSSVRCVPAMPTSECGSAGRRRRSTCGVRKARLARRRVRTAGGHRLHVVSCRWVLHAACCMLHAACCLLRAATWDRTGGAVRCICVLQQRRGVTRNRQCQPSNICPHPHAHARTQTHTYTHALIVGACVSACACVRVCVCVCACARVCVRVRA